MPSLRSLIHSSQLQVQVLCWNRLLTRRLEAKTPKPWQYRSAGIDKAIAC